MGRLAKGIGIGILVLGIEGCNRMRGDFDIDIDDPVEVSVEHRSASLFKDIDGNNLPDFVYGVHVRLYNSKDADNTYRGYWRDEYEIVWRKNLGEGRFAEPQVILTVPQEKPMDVQFLYSRKDVRKNPIR